MFSSALPDIDFSSSHRLSRLLPFPLCSLSLSRLGSFRWMTAFLRGLFVFQRRALSFPSSADDSLAMTEDRTARLRRRAVGGGGGGEDECADLSGEEMAGCMSSGVGGEGGGSPQPCESRRRTSSSRPSQSRAGVFSGTNDSSKSCGICCGCSGCEPAKNSLALQAKKPSAASVYREHAAHYTHKFRADIDYKNRERPRQVLWGTVLIVLLLLIGFYDDLSLSFLFSSHAGVRTPQSAGVGEKEPPVDHRGKEHATLLSSSPRGSGPYEDASEAEASDKAPPRRESPREKEAISDASKTKGSVSQEKDAWPSPPVEKEEKKKNSRANDAEAPGRQSEDEEYCSRFPQDSKCSPPALHSTVPSSPSASFSSSFLSDEGPARGSPTPATEIPVQTGGVAPSLFGALFGSSSPSVLSPSNSVFLRHSASMKRVVLALLVLVCLYCFLQSKDGLLVRPHPGFWRVVHGVCLVHLLVMVILLVVEEDTGGLLLELLFPEISGKRRSVFSGTLVMDCRINLETLQRQVRSVWFVSHVVGWLCKMMILRHWGFCLLYSLAFELGELSFQWLVPELCECWWDSIFIDAVLSNVSGMLLGAAIMKLGRIYQYDWLGCHPLCKRVCISFTPFTSENYDWSFFKTPRHLFLAVVLLLLCLFVELNVFFLMAALGIPATHYVNPLRTIYLSLLGASAAAEHYEYTMYSRERIGHNEWLLAIILCIEVLVCVKYGRSKFPRFLPPAEILLPWVIALSLLSVWCYCYFTTMPLRSGGHHERRKQHGTVVETRGEDVLDLSEELDTKREGDACSQKTGAERIAYGGGEARRSSLSQQQQRGGQERTGPGLVEDRQTAAGESKHLDEKDKASSRRYDWSDRVKLLILTVPPQACLLPLLYLMKFYFYDFVQLERKW